MESENPKKRIKKFKQEKITESFGSFKNTTETSTEISNLTNPNIIISTQSSSLILHDLCPTWIERLPLITEEIDSSLDYHPAIMLFGKLCHQQRSVGFYSDESIGYRYSNSISSAKPLTTSLSELLSYINNRFGAEFNGILV